MGQSQHKLPILPKDMWCQIIMWLSPIDAIRISRTCKMFQNITNDSKFWQKKYKCDFNNTNIPTEYRKLIQNLMSDKDLRKIMYLSFGITKRELCYYHVSKKESVRLNKHLDKLNRLGYRNKEPLRMRSIECTTDIKVCSRCQSSNIVIWGEFNYVDCYADGCKATTQVSWSNKVIPTGDYFIEIYRSSNKMKLTKNEVK